MRSTPTHKLSRHNFLFQSCEHTLTELTLCTIPQNSYPILFKSLKEIQKLSPTPANTAAVEPTAVVEPTVVIVNSLVDEELKFFEGLDQSARELIAALSSFELQTKEDRGKVVRVRRSLDTALLAAEGG